MQIGDKVEVIGIPSALPEGQLHTRHLFEMCVGRVFPIVGFQGDLLELEVGEIVGEAPYIHSIWIEREHLKLAD